MYRLYRSNAEDAKVIRAIILSDDVIDDDSIDDGIEWDGKYVEPKKKVTRKVQKTLRRMIIAAMKWALLTDVFSGKD